MSILRERMIQDMQLRGFSPRTQDSYARAVRKLAEHYHKSPDLVTDEELRQYFLHRTNVSQWSRVACTIALCGIKFFYEHTLKRDWTTVRLLKPKRIKSLPTIRSQTRPTLLTPVETRSRCAFTQTNPTSHILICSPHCLRPLRIRPQQRSKFQRPSLIAAQSNLDLQPDRPVRCEVLFVRLLVAFLISGVPQCHRLIHPNRQQSLLAQETIWLVVLA